MPSAFLLMLLAAPLWDSPFELRQPGEAVARVIARCAGCSWGDERATGALLVLEVDGAYARHLVLSRGDEAAEYGVLLGPLAAGRHRVVLRTERAPQPTGLHPITIERVRIDATAEADPDHRAVALAPILHPRENALGRFTDVPLVMWYETEPTTRGTRIRYSVVFSNEDGGTPSDRLLATWGRLTDIEYVLGIEMGRDGRVLDAEYQGPDHRIQHLTLPARGHPELWVVTDNNMVSDHGATTPSYAPVPIPFDLRGSSREAVMDAYPWTYAVSSLEAAREGHTGDDARPGSGRVPDPRRFVYVEACAETQDAALTFAVRTGEGETRAWFESDGGQPDFRIRRRADQFPSGCFRGAVALPAGSNADDVSALRFRAFTAARDVGATAPAPGAAHARLRRVARVFVLDAEYQPRLLPMTWRGDLDLPVDGEAMVVPVIAAAPGPLP